MTSEVVVMNRLSVALAADSASTVTGPDGKEKIWNSANKLFALSRCQPVGVMFYNDASIAGVPWETLVKEYRSSSFGNKAFNSLEEYACAFVDFLRKNLKFFSKEAQEEIFLRSVEGRFSEIYQAGYQEFVRKIMQGNANKKITLTNELAAVIDPEFERWNKKKELLVVGRAVATAIPRLYGKRIRGLVKSQFPGAEFDRNTRAKLVKLATLYGTKDDFVSDYTGMVFAGFGKKDLYPVVRHLKIGLVIGGYFRYTKDTDQRISENVPSLILPFAQRDMVETFLHGVSPKIRHTILRACAATTTGLTSLIIERIDDLNEDRKEHWKKALAQHGSHLLRGVAQEFERSQNATKWPILGALVHLPKDELANVAESLVNLNYFQKKVSMDSETIGGPIDVAVISKGDGFIWIKRKHYFAADLNPQFFMSLERQFNGGARNERKKAG